MAACEQLVHALRDSGQETLQRSVPSPVGMMGDMGMSPWLRMSNMTKKFRSKRLITTAIAISTTSVAGLIRPTPSGELSPISTQIKVVLTSRKGTHPLMCALFDQCLKCLTPVKTIAIPYLSAASIDSWLLINQLYQKG